MKKSSLILLALFISIIAKSQLVINEISQGFGSGSKEYIELLVLGTKTCTDSCMDLRNWIVDDNNGWHAPGAGTGIAAGCIRFKNIPQWQCVKYGTIILLYNPQDKNLSITAADDITDSNNDGVYILPVGTASTTVLEVNTAKPSTTVSSYGGLTYSALTATSYSVLGLRNAGDAFHTVSPADTTVPYFSIGWGNVNQNLTIYNPGIPGDAGDSVFMMLNTVNNDITNIANWGFKLAPANETPGLPNSLANATWINSLRTQSGGAKKDTLRPTICAGQSYPTKAGNQTNAGTYRDTFALASGCDSIVVTVLSVQQATAASQNVSACGQLVYKGKTYTNSTVVLDTIKSVGGCDSIRNTTNINITPIPNVTIAVTQNCGSATLTASGATSYVWSNSATGSSITVNSGGMFSVVGTTNTCTASATQTVSISSSITVSITETQNCGNTILTASGGSSYVWTGGSTANPITVSTGGSYSVTGTTGGCTGIATQNVVIFQSPAIHQDLVVKNCGSTSITISGANSYVWSEGTVGPTLTSTVAGTFTVTASNGGNCIATAIFTLDIFSGLNTYNRNVCIYNGQSYFAGGANQTTAGIYVDTAKFVGGCDSIIFTDLRVITAVVDTLKLDGCNSVTYNNTIYTSDEISTIKLNSAFGCDSITRTLFIHIRKLDVDIEASGANLPITSGESIDLKAVSDSAILTYAWTPNQYVTSSSLTAATISSKPDKDITYTVTVKDSFCTDTAVFLVSVTQPETIFAMPTAFSPNGDGVNDLYRPILLPNLTTKEFRIFNRWGEKVYETSSSTLGWDGTFKDSKQPIGVYVYYIVVQNTISGKTSNHFGNVTLIR